MAGIRFSAVLLSPEMSLPTLVPALEKRDSSPDILVKRCNVKGSFYKELADRIISLPANQEELGDYGRYVSIIRRHWLKISREELATIAELETEYLLFLENNLIKSDEIDDIIKHRLELALGISYDEFDKFQGRFRQLLDTSL